jgi:hypothetical protein
LELSARRLLNEAGERAAKARALRAAAGVFSEVVRHAACVNEAIERTAARDELVDEVSILAGAEAVELFTRGSFLQLGYREPKRRKKGKQREREEEEDE